MMRREAVASPMSACPVRSRTYDRATVVIPLATLPAHEDQASLDRFAVGEPHRTIIWRGCVRA